MNPGTLDARIQIQGLTVEPNSVGDAIETWATVATVWAEYRELKGGELTDAMQKIAEVEAKFIVRHNSLTASIGSKHRVLYSGVEYDVLETLRIPGHRPVRVELLVKRRDDQ